MAMAFAVNPLEKGLAALEHGHTYLAMSCLEQAMVSVKSPQVCAKLAYCLAVNNKDMERATRLAREALDAEPDNTSFRLNLGRVLLHAGRKDEAIRVVRQGVSHGSDPELIALLEQLGTRKRPVFPTLPRGHFLNKWAGRLLSWLGLR